MDAKEIEAARMLAASLREISDQAGVVVGNTRYSGYDLREVLSKAIAEMDATAAAVEQLADALEQAQAELSGMREQRDTWYKLNTDAEQTMADLSARIAAVTAERDRYAAALDFYANPQTWLDRNNGPTHSDFDMGYIARSARQEGGE